MNAYWNEAAGYEHAGGFLLFHPIEIDVQNYREYRQRSRGRILPRLESLVLRNCVGTTLFNLCDRGYIGASLRISENAEAVNLFGELWVDRYYVGKTLLGLKKAAQVIDAKRTGIILEAKVEGYSGGTVLDALIEQYGSAIRTATINGQRVGI